MPPKAPPRRGGGAASRRNDLSNPDTSASPAPQPAASSTSTPTPTPTGTARAPVQRLQSLKKRTASGSIGPSSTRPSPAAGTAAATPVKGGPSNGNEPSKPTLKYQPRAVGRRSKEEREKIEKLEAQRNRERLAEAAAIQRGKMSLAARGRAGFSGRGGRGGALGAGAAGPLGSGMAMGGGARRGRGGGSGGGGRFDSRASSMSRRSRSIMDGGDAGGEGGYGGGISSDEDDSEIRISIDRINLDSDADDEKGEGDEDEDMILEKKKKGGKWKGKIPSRGGRERGLRPIRVERHEHQERTVSVNMESSSSKSAELREQAKENAKAGDDGALFVQDDDGEGSATPTEAEPTRVKKEPTDDDDQVMEDVPLAEEPVTTDDGLLPAPKVKVRRKLGSREQSVVKEEPEQEKAKGKEKEKDPKSLLRTKEDIEEFDRHIRDLEEVKKLLSREPRKEQQSTPTTEKKDADPSAEGPDVITTTTTEDGEKAEGGEEDEVAQDKLAGQLFLVQFPPITPNLIIPGEEIPEGDSEPVTTQSATQDGDPALKREDGVEVLDGPEEPSGPVKSSKVVTAADWTLQPGRVGKLNVHASGRVTMDWGGISFELDRATEVNFLQEALIVSTPPHVETEVVDDEHKVWAMGQLSGKFIVTPDWEKML